MYLVPIAWLYVVLMMSVVEAMAPNGSLLGALFTFALYGALPLSVVMYVMGTPLRRRRQRDAERASAAQAAAVRLAEPDAGHVAAGDAVAPERKET